MRPPGRWRRARLALLAAALPAGAPPATARFDLIIRHGTVFDGTGASPIVADVGVSGDRIVAVGDLSRDHAAQEEDATGLYVTPGFISVHDHSEAKSYGRPEGLLTQGVTTAIANPDGGGDLDIAKQLSPPGGLGLNYGAYVGFNSVWRAVVGLDDRRATPAEIERMRALVLGGLKAGAFGLSSGLDYKPSFWATTDEVVAVAKVAAPWRTNFPNHERVFTGNGFSSMAGMAETVAIGERSGVTPVITHMKLQGRDHGKVAAAFAMFAAARARGVPVGVDAYPYTFGATSLEQLLIPDWAQSGGMEAMLARFKDPALRVRIVADTNRTVDVRWGGAQDVYIVDLQRELTAIMAERHIDAGEAIVRLLEEGNRRVILRFGTEEDQRAIVANQLTAVSCDCGATTATAGHPRNWGSYPRFLGRYVREGRLVGWSEAVRKMTALPASMIGLSERGYLRPGMIADLTVFDPETVADRATIDRPTLRSVGIRDVIVNGRYALHAGGMVPVQAGVRLVRSRHEPTRPMAMGMRAVSVVGATSGGARVAVRLTQASAAARPDGVAEVTGLPDGTSLTLRATMVQAAPGWASITGLAHRRQGRDRAATLQVEQADPFAGGKPTITVLSEGAIVLDSAALPAGAVAIRQGRG